MGEFLGQFAIVSEHKYACGALVESTYREYPEWATLEKLHDCLLCVRIARCSDISFRFVHYQVYFLLALELFAVELDFVLIDVYLSSQFGNDLSVNRNHTCLKEGVGLAS